MVGVSDAAERVLAVDIGGTKVAAGLVDRRGRILASEVRPTEPARGRAAVVERIVGMARGLAAAGIGSGAGPLALGVGTAGQVDHASGTIVDASRRLPPDWPGTPLADLLRAALNLPVTVLNDGQAMALGELHFGAARGARHAFCLAVGTGVGGGLIAGGELHLGAHGIAGQFGHTLVRHGGRRCTCGRRGHLEAYVSGPEIERRYRALGGTGDALEAARHGNPLARRALGEAADCLAAALAGLLNLVDAEVAVIGGGVAEAAPELVDLVRTALAGQPLTAIGHDVRVVPAALGARAGLIGASVAAFALTDRVTPDDSPAGRMIPPRAKVGVDA